MTDRSQTYFDTRIKALSNELDQLEIKAGIHEEAELARDSYGKYSRREAVRNAYFSVKDKKTRKSLIEKEDEINKLESDSIHWQIVGVQKKIWNARDSEDYWFIKSSVFSAIFIFVCSKYLGIEGLALGMMISYCFSVSLKESIRKKKRSVISDLNTEKSELLSIQKDLDLHTFTLSELITFERSIDEKDKTKKKSSL